MRARFGASLAVVVALVGCTLKGTPVATNQHAKGGGTAQAMQQRFGLTRRGVPVGG